MRDPYFECSFGPEEFKHFARSRDAKAWDYPIYEDSETPVLVFDSKKKLKLHLMHFSFIPHWKKTFNKRFTSAFARRETVMEKKLWSHSLKSKRCLVPISAFYASFHSGEFTGNLMRISHPDQPILYAAGLWDYWESKTQFLYSFAIITTPATDYNLIGTARRAPLFVPSRYQDFWMNEGSEIEPQFFERSLVEYAETNWNFDLERKLKSKPAKPKETYG